MKKLIKDLFQEPCGKWSIKRVFAGIAFLDALIYEALGGFNFFESKEYVFIGLLGFTATAIGLTVLANKLKKD